MTVSTRDDSWPTCFLVGLFAVALTLLVTALFLWIRGPRDAGRMASAATASAAARVVLATETAGRRLVTEGTATPVPVARGTESAGVPPAPTAALVSPSVEPARTIAAEAGATGTATPTPGPAATATSAVVIPLAPPGEAGAAGTVEGQLALEGRTLFSGTTLLVDGMPAATTDEAGDFRLVVPAGQHTVAARHPGYITIEATGVEVRPGDTTRLPATELRAGDTDEDGDVDLFDVVRCVIGLGQKSQARTMHADVNGDGTVDLRDVILAQRNYRGVSPAPWQVSDQ